MTSIHDLPIEILQLILVDQPYPDIIRRTCKLWYKAVKNIVSYNVATIASILCDLPILKWAHKQRYRFSGGTVGRESYCCYQAVKYGRLDIVQWLCNEGLVQDANDIMLNAATWGRADIMDWAFSQGMRVGKRAYSMAAEQGHIAVLECLRTHGVEIPPKMIIDAAYAGHIPVLEWAEKQCIPWPEYTYNAAWSAGRKETAEWLLDHGCSMWS